VDRTLPAWVVAKVTFIADAWGRLDPATRARVDADAVVAGDAARARVVAALRDLFATAPAEQRTTPLEIVRTAAREVTEVLAAAGIPPVERDEFAERAFPDDHYDVTPATLADLGEDDLAPLQLVWGLAKAKVMRADVTADGGDG
jgi:hypothetical protein